MEDTPLRHVSDTARWVAAFRARETERPDALFRDPLARVLVGEDGERIIREMEGSAAVGWSVVVRTCLIDDYLSQGIKEGVDTVLNLGAGLDTRPYRLELPEDLLWVEVDFPELIQFKQEKLSGQSPRVRLERLGMDLADRGARTSLLERLQDTRRKVLVLTEGVLPYLPNEKVEELARDLRAQSRFELWIVDYWSKMFLQRMRRSKTFSKMRNAPFVFDPPDWKEFFESTGWQIDQLRYTGAEGQKLGRRAPFPFWMKILGLLLPPEQKQQIARMSGYALLRAGRTVGV